MNDSIEIFLEVLIITFIGTLGNILFKIGTDGFGKLSFGSFFSQEFLMKAFFTKYGWVVFFSLLINLASRIMTMSPLSKGKSGIVWSLSIPLSLILMVLSGHFIFGEEYTIKEIVGIVVTTVGLVMMI